MSENTEYRNYDYAGDALRWVAAGFGIGLLVGGALGILLAPKTGTETREQLKGFASDFGERAKVVAGDFGERAMTTASGIRDQATTTYSQVAGSATGAAGDISKTAKNVSTTITDGISTIKSASTRFQQAVKDGYIKKMEELGGSEGEACEAPDGETTISADDTPRPRTRRRKETEEEENL